jgi:hypothetical protein
MTDQNLYQPQASDDFYVDIAGAVLVLHALGLTDASDRSVRRDADEGRLPFFKRGKKRRIEVKELRASIKRLQIEASRGLNR